MRGADRRAALGVAAVFCLAAPAVAEDRVSVRGMYYREASTRVIQPLAAVTKDLPAGFDIGAHYAVDQITSASEAQGNSTDAIRTEWRHEAGLIVGKRFDRTRVAIAGRESREPDYQARSGGISVARGVWENSGLVAANASYGRDVFSEGPLEDPRTRYHLTTLFAGVAYEQSILPTLRAQLGYEFMYQDGFLGNPYRRTPNLGREQPPKERWRHALSPRVAKYFPALTLGVQLHYRLYFDHWMDDARDMAGTLDTPGYDRDPWNAFAHTVEARVHKELGRDVEVRASYRFHKQSNANFFCSTNVALGGTTNCYGPFPLFHSGDEKLGALATHMPEVKLYWTLRVFAGIPFLRHFSHGTVEVSYAYLFQETHYGDAHFLQSGYTLPF